MTGECDYNINIINYARSNYMLLDKNKCSNVKGKDKAEFDYAKILVRNQFANPFVTLI